MTKKPIISQINWQEFTQTSLPDSIYHDIRWLKIIEKSFGLKSTIFVAKDAELELAYLPIVKLKNPIFGNSLISLPFLNGGGINWANEFPSEQVANKLYEALNQELLAGYDYLELRTNSNQLKNNPDFICREHKVTFVLELQIQPEEIFQKFSKKLRNQIKKPEKSGATCRVIPGQEVTEQDRALFYQIMSEHWRDLGSPIYSKKFFDLVFQEFKEQLLLSIITTAKGIPCSVGLTIINKQQAEICWAASLKSYNRLSPNMLLYWSTIKKLAELGVARFDFGRCSKDSGTYHFKQQWGSEERQLYWYYPRNSRKIPNVSSDNPKFRLAIKVWKKLPVWLATLIGNQIAKFFP